MKHSASLKLTTPLKQKNSLKKRPPLKQALRILTGLLLLWFICHIVYVIYDGLHDYKGKADLAIVLGSDVYKDGTLSPVLKGRVDKALLLYNEGAVQKIMVSGGDGRPKYFVPEGTAMKRYLVSKGVPAQIIIEDNAGQNTYLTAKDFLLLNDSLHFSSAIVVSSFYHITRSKYIIRKLGFKNVHSASSDTFFWNDGLSIIRDFLAFYKYLLVY
jgi:vancomycin permeability regulator SanA